jgi:hypothetical protein
LAVAVEHHGHVPGVLGGVVVTRLLVAAVPEVAGLALDRDRQLGVGIAVRLGHLERVVGRVVVEDQDLGEFVANPLWEAVEYGRDGGLGVVCHDHNTNLHRVLPPGRLDRAQRRQRLPW